VLSLEVVHVEGAASLAQLTRALQSRRRRQLDKKIAAVWKAGEEYRLVSKVSNQMTKDECAKR